MTLLSFRRRLPGASLFLALPALLFHGMAGWLPGLALHLQLDRRAVAAGQVWRLLTGHWVHWSGDHLLWDLAAFAGLAAACELRPGGRRRLLWAVGLAAVAIPAVLWAALPGMVFYRGLSGIDSALFALLVVTFLREDLAAGRRGWAAIELLGLGLFLGKCGYETATGQAFFLSGEDFVPVPLAHVVGGICGLLVAFSGRKILQTPDRRILTCMETEIDLPRVNPIGILEQPAGYVATPRRFSRGMRALALALLLAFATVTVATTVVSLGVYCLTTEPGDVRSLPAHRAPLR